MNNEERFFSDITDSLHAHEDAYIDGAWEAFVDKKRRKRFPLYIRMAGAAALLLILGYAVLLYVPQSTQKKSRKYQAKNIIRPNQTNPKTSVDKEGLTDITGITPPSINKKNSLTINNRNEERPKPLFYDPVEKYGDGVPVKTYTTDSSSIAFNNLSKTVPVSDDQPTKSESSLPDVVSTNIKRYDKNARLNYNSLAGLKKPEKTPAKSAASNKALSYALQLSPSVGNERLNFGTGVEVGYKLSKNFSVSTGIGYSYINAGSNRGSLTPEATYSNVSNSSSASPSSNYSSGTSQTVKGVRLALSGLELPLNFQYKTSGGLYFSAGVAAMSIIGNNLSYNYLNNRAESVASANGLTSDIRIISEESTKQSTENVRGYVGFYTFSAGKKITIGRTQLKFAPFVKIPFTGVSSEKIQLLHGGVQLGIGF